MHGGTAMECAEFVMYPNQDDKNHPVQYLWIPRELEDFHHQQKQQACSNTATHKVYFVILECPLGVS